MLPESGPQKRSAHIWFVLKGNLRVMEMESQGYAIPKVLIIFECISANVKGVWLMELFSMRIVCSSFKDSKCI